MYYTMILTINNISQHRSISKETRNFYCCKNATLVYGCLNICTTIPDLETGNLKTKRFFGDTEILETRNVLMLDLCPKNFFVFKFRVSTSGMVVPTLYQSCIRVVVPSLWDATLGRGLG